MLIGYARVSKADGSQLLDLQRDALIDAGVAEERIYEDLASGRKDHRLGLKSCLKALQPGNTFVVWKLDRLGRDLKHLVSTVAFFGLIVFSISGCSDEKDAEFQAGYGDGNAVGYNTASNWNMYDPKDAEFQAGYGDGNAGRYAVHFGYNTACKLEYVHMIHGLVEPGLFRGIRHGRQGGDHRMPRGFCTENRTVIDPAARAAALPDNLLRSPATAPGRAPQEAAERT